MSYIQIGEAVFWASDVRIALGPTKVFDAQLLGYFAGKLPLGQNFVWKVAFVLADLPNQGRVEFNRINYSEAMDLLKQVLEKVMEYRNATDPIGQTITPLLVSTGG